MNENGITVKYTPTSSDFVRILIWYRWKRLAITFGIVLVVLFFITIYLANAKSKTQNPDAVQTLVITMIISPLVVTGLTYLSIRRQAKKIEASAQASEVIFETDGIKMITPNASSESKWERYQKVFETKRDFIFFPQHNIFFGIPKRHFADGVEIGRLREILKQGLGKKAKLRA